MEFIGIVIILIIVIAAVLVGFFIKSLFWSTIMFFISHFIGSVTPQPPAIYADDPEDTAERHEFVQKTQENHGAVYKEKIIARILKPLPSVDDKTVHWNIICTEAAVYFFKLSKSVPASTPMPWELNLFLRITMRSYIKKAEATVGLENLVSRCANAIRVGFSEFGRIKLQPDVNQVEFENKGKIYRIILPPSEYRLFAETLKNSYTS